MVAVMRKVMKAELGVINAKEELRAWKMQD